MTDGSRTTGFTISLDGVPLCSTRTLADAYGVLATCPKGLVVIEFEHAGEVIRLSRYNFMADWGFNVAVG